MDAPVITPTEPMSFDQAITIVHAINNRAFFGMGLKLTGPIGSLEGISLAQMLEATAVVRASNDAPAQDFPRTIHVVPAERLIAAAYVLEHYQPSTEAIVVRPTGEWPYDRRALAVVGLEPGQGEEEEEGE